MNSLRTLIEQRLDALLDGLESAPLMFGGPESVELQGILLLELRAMVAAPHADARDPRRIYDGWCKLVRRQHPDAGNRLLAAAMQGIHPNDEHAQAEGIASFLAAFRRSLMADLQAENPYAVHDLAICLRIPRGKPLPTASRVGTYYDLVGRVLRGVAQRGGGRGRLRQELEDAIILRPAAGFEIVAENDNHGAQIVMPLAWPGSTQPALPGASSADTDVREEFARFLTVAEWASTSEELDDLMHAATEREARTRMALEALRLIPRRDSMVESVEIGGRAVMRQRPVALGPESQGRFLEVVREGRTSQAFEREGVIRAADLDAGRFRLKLDDGTSRTIWLEDADLTERAASVLGRRVRVSGHEYTRQSRAVFVVASTLEPTDPDDSGDAEESLP